MSLPLLGCYAHQGKLLGTIHVACSNIAPRKYPSSSHATAFFHLTPMASPGPPPAIPLKIYQRPGTGALSHPARQGTGWGVSTGWGQPPGHPPSPHRAGGQLAGRSPLTAPRARHCNSYRADAHFFAQGGKTPRDCQAAKLSAKNTIQTHFSLGPLKKRKSEGILVATEITWTKAGEERKGEADRGNEMG